MIETIDVRQLLPYKGDFLLVHGVEEFDEAIETLVAVHQTKETDPWVEGHFGVMPGTMQLEFAAQACVLLAKLLGGKGLPYHAEDKLVRYVGRVFPGDRLTVRVNLLKHKRIYWNFEFKVDADNRHTTVVRGEITGIEVKQVTQLAA